MKYVTIQFETSNDDSDETIIDVIQTLAYCRKKRIVHNFQVNQHEIKTK